ncbi:MAG: hypothetical protein PHW79_05290 [Candidatus Marinimicrobia bacterium]|nr:hypothetical protein [Candidatus Neomarinimicrobiota bacterium]
MGRSTLIIVLGFVIIFGYISIRMNRTAQLAEENSIDFTETVIARQVANSAIEYLISLHSVSGYIDTTISRDSWLGGSFSGTITTVAYDTIAGEDSVLITVTAEVGEQTITTSVTFWSRDLLLPVIPAAVGICTNSTDLTITGHSHIYGSDTDMDGTTSRRGWHRGPGGPRWGGGWHGGRRHHGWHHHMYEPPDLSEDLPGVSVSEEADSIDLMDQYEGSTKIQGEGTSPSIALYNESTQEEIQAVADAYEAIADYNLTSCDGLGSVTLGSPSSPVVVHVSGECTITGNLTGYGVLVAEGITFRGRVKWNGIVIITGDADADLSSNGNSSICGALLLGAPTATVSIKGNDALYFSSEAIQMIETHITSTENNPKWVNSLTWWD